RRLPVAAVRARRQPGPGLRPQPRPGPGDRARPPGDNRAPGGPHRRLVPGSARLRPPRPRARARPGGPPRAPGPGPGARGRPRPVPEHGPGPAVLGGAVARGLEPGGVAYLEVPDGWYLVDRVALWDVIYEHVHHVTAPALRRLAVDAGLRVPRSGTAFGDQF